MPPSSLGVFLFLLTAPSYGRWAHENSGVLSENSSVETRVGSETDQASGLAGIGPSLSIGKLAESRSFQNLSSKAAATAAVPARTIEFDDVTEKILPKMLGIPKVVFLFGACLLYVLVHWIVSIRGCGRRESPQVKTLNVTVVLNYADCTTATIRLENNAEESKGKNFSTREATSSVSLQWNPALSEAARDSDGNYLRVEVIDENEEIVKTSNIPVQTAGSNGDIPSYHRVQWNREGEREFLMLGISHDVGEMHRTGVKVVTKHINGQRKNREPSYAPMMTFFMIYLIVGTTFYTQWEGWDEMSAVYFCVSTMFTVGYGDFVPSDRVSRVFTALLAIVGVSFLGITLVVTQIDTVLAMVKHERTRTRTNVRKMLNGVALCFIIELFNLIFAMCALNLLEGFDALDAAYFLVMTSLTEGFGDVSVETSWGKLAVVAYIFVECLALGQIVRIIFTWYTKKRMAELLGAGDSEDARQTQTYEFAKEQRASGTIMTASYVKP